MDERSILKRKGIAQMNTVTYDYWTNGGTAGPTTSTVTVNSGTAVNVDPAVMTATKAGWTFLGWNTRSDATSGLSAYTPTSNATLYAIYAKTLTATFIDYSGVTRIVQEAPTTIYNQATSGNVPIPAQNPYASWNKWTAQGWSRSTAADANVEITSGQYPISDNVTFYGLYKRTAVISYDATGGAPTPPPQILTQKTNSYAVSSYTTPMHVTLPTQVTKAGYILDGWFNSWNGNKMPPGTVSWPDFDATFTASWKADQYLTVFKTGGTSETNPWDASRPETFNQASFDEIIKTYGTKGTGNRRLSVAYAFSYLNHELNKIKASLQNMMNLSVANELPIVIHLDGVNEWENSPELWNWFDSSKPGFKEANIANVERYGWDDSTAVKVCWRNWGNYPHNQRRVAPQPNLASNEFRQANKTKLEAILPEIRNWYQNLPADKKYLFGGVVLGWELSPYWNACYYQIKDGDGNIIRNGNDYWNILPHGTPEEINAKDLELGFDTGPKDTSKTVKLGYAAARDMNLQNGQDALTNESVGEIMNSYIEYLVNISKAYIEPDKLITHTFALGNHPMEAAFSHVNGVMPGWTTNLEHTQLYMPLSKLGSRPWAVSEMAFNYTNAQNLEGLFNHGDCRMINMKTFPYVSKEFGPVKAITAALDSNGEYRTVKFDVQTNGGTSTTQHVVTVRSGTVINLTSSTAPTAKKENWNKSGWEFIGWNTNKNATSGMPSFTPSESEETLYAIYRKILTVKFVDYEGSTQKERIVQALPMYNNNEETTVLVPKQNNFDGYTARGWDYQTTLANAAPAALEGDYYPIKYDGTIFFGLYMRDFKITYNDRGTLSYDTATKYYNSKNINGGTRTYMTPPLLSREGFTHVGWMLGYPPYTEYTPGVPSEINGDRYLNAIWQ